MARWLRAHTALTEDVGGFGSQHLPGGLSPSITPVPEDLTLTSDLYTGMQTKYSYTFKICKHMHLFFFKLQHRLGKNSWGPTLRWGPLAVDSSWEESHFSLRMWLLVGCPCPSEWPTLNDHMVSTNCTTTKNKRKHEVRREIRWKGPGESRREALVGG